MQSPQKIPDIKEQSSASHQPGDHGAEQHTQDAVVRDETDAVHESRRHAPHDQHECAVADRAASGGGQAAREEGDEDHQRERRDERERASPSAVQQALRAGGALPWGHGYRHSSGHQPGRVSSAALLRASSGGHSRASHIMALIEASSTAMVTPSIQAKYHMAIPRSEE